MPKLAAVSRRSLVAWATVAAVALGFGVSSAASAHSSSAARRAQALTPVPRGFVGIVVDEPVWPDAFVNLPQQLDVMVASGVESMRVVFDWSQAQPYQSWSQVPQADQSQFVNVGGIPTNFTAYDALVGGAAARGLTVLPVIENAPAWDGQTYPGGIVALPRTPAPYAAFVRALVRRYGSGGTFWSANPQIPKVPITMWQIWNEPNIPAFWPQQPYYSRYVTLLRAASAAVRSSDRKAKVVLAGLPNYSWIELARLYKFRGFRRLFDVVAVHPYTKTPQGVITIIGYARRAMDLAGDAAKPIVADEISWPSSLGRTIHNVGYDFATTESGQATNLGKVMPLLVKNRDRLGIGAFYYYDWAGQDRPNFLAFDFSGLFAFGDDQFTPKPAYGVFRRAALAMEGCQAKIGRASDCQH
jgi:polysaccharide biosynthesis protein PslG